MVYDAKIDHTRHLPRFRIDKNVLWLKIKVNGRLVALVPWQRLCHAGNKIPEIMGEKLYFFRFEYV